MEPVRFDSFTGVGNITKYSCKWTEDQKKMLKVRGETWEFSSYEVSYLQSKLG